MKKFTTVLSIAALLINMAALTGCKPNGEGSDTPTGSDSSSAITDSTGNSDSSSNSDSSTAPESAPEPPKPAGEPTFLTAPDGTPIYTSEISEVYTGSEQFDNKKTITLAEAEQLANAREQFHRKMRRLCLRVYPRESAQSCGKSRNVQGQRKRQF